MLDYRIESVLARVVKVQASSSNAHHLCLCSVCNLPDESLRQFYACVLFFSRYWVLKTLDLYIHNIWDRETTLLAVDFYFKIYKLWIKIILYRSSKYGKRPVSFGLTLKNANYGFSLAFVCLLGNVYLDSSIAFMNGFWPRARINNIKAVKLHISITSRSDVIQY